MKKWRSGFTIIEVTLFLAITGLLFVGIMVGTQTSINQQRSYDSIQSFVEFLRSVYSGVTNPQSILDGGGKSDKAIYGKMVVFGEEKDLSGANNSQNQVFVYDVVGKVDSTKVSINGNLASVYGDLDLNVKDKEDKFVGIPDSYIPKWQSTIETAEPGNKLFEGTILILRHPRSGTVNTLFNSTVIDVNGQNFNQIKNSIKNNIGSFEQEQIDFCMNSLDDPARRTDIRIIDGAHNASGVQIIDLDSDDNKCK